MDLDRAVPRLAHSATQVGSYVFIIGGHDGTKYSNNVLLLNLGMIYINMFDTYDIKVEFISDHELGNKKNLRWCTKRKRLPYICIT